MTREAKQVRDRMGLILMDLVEKNITYQDFFDSHYGCRFCQKYRDVCYQRESRECMECPVFQNLDNQKCIKVFLSLSRKIKRYRPLHKNIISMIMAIIIWMEVL